MDDEKQSLIWKALIAIGFILAQSVILYTFYETQKMTKNIETIRLAREVYSEFYLTEGTYRKIRNAIESCAPLYKSWGGIFTHDEINKYLGFFEDLGYYFRRGHLDLEIIGHFYGSYIIEAYEYPEIRKYIGLLRQNFSQPSAFVEFDAIAQALEKDNQFKALKEKTETMCDRQDHPQPE